MIILLISDKQRRKIHGVHIGSRYNERRKFFTYNVSRFI